MNLTDDLTLKFQKGSPVDLYGICKIYSRTIGEIIDEDFTKFQRYLSILTAEKPTDIGKDDKEFTKLIEGLTDFQYILMMVLTDKESNEVFRKAFEFFTNESDISFSFDPAQIIVGPVEEGHCIDEGKFYDFQKILRRMYFLEQDGEEIIINDDDDPMVKKLKMQRRRDRERLRKAKAKKAKQEKNDLKFSDLIGSIPLDNCNLNMVNIWDVTYYSLQDQLKRMGWRDQFEMNHRAALAGAKLKKSQLKHWMRSIASSDKS